MHRKNPTLDELITDRAERLTALKSAIEERQAQVRKLEMELEVLTRIRSEQRDRQESPGQRSFPEVARAVARVTAEMSIFGLRSAEIRSLDRSAAVERILEMSENPLSPSEIEGRLASFGRVDGYDAVSAALAYLKRSGRAHSLRRGEWVAGPAPSQRQTFSEAIASHALPASTERIGQ